MTCPKCEGKMSTAETREGKGYIRRRRFCSCGFVTHTREIDVARYKELLETERLFNDLVKFGSSKN